MVATQIFIIFTPNKTGKIFTHFDEPIFQLGGEKPPTSSVCLLHVFLVKTHTFPAMAFFTSPSGTPLKMNGWKHGATWGVWFKSFSLYFTWVMMAAMGERSPLSGHQVDEWLLSPETSSCGAGLVLHDGGAAGRDEWGGMGGWYRKGSGSPTSFTISWMVKVGGLRVSLIFFMT